jgi:hypothetical protein
LIFQQIFDSAEAACMKHLYFTAQSADPHEAREHSQVVDFEKEKRARNTLARLMLC